MKIIYVDDERSAHVNFRYDMKGREEVETLHCFFSIQEALSFAKENPVDCAFLDIELGGKGGNGLVLAEGLKAIHPNIEVVFVTAYDQYARASYRVGGRAYLTKPYTPEELDKVLDMLKKMTMAHRQDESNAKPQPRVVIKIFGNFDLLIDNRPVAFKNAKAKELLAFLVHQRGGTVSGAQIFFALWEAQEYTPSTSTYVRRTARALKDELERLDLLDILINKRNCYSVDTSRLSCDYYFLMDGDATAADRYNGEYMNQYSWGESTIPMINRKAASIQGL